MIIESNNWVLAKLLIEIVLNNYINKIINHFEYTPVFLKNFYLTACNTYQVIHHHNLYLKKLK